jgi:hypothetical protein
MLHVSQRRETLQSQINAFHMMAAKMLGDIEDEHSGMDLDIVDEDWGDDMGSDADTDEESNPFLMPRPRPMQEEGYPERLLLHLPSHFTAARSNTSHFRSMVKKEIALRVGQANDCLQSIRLGIGNKSFAFRGRMRVSKYKKQKTRTWDTIHALDNGLSHHRRVYNSAIKALKALEADASIMDQFQDIKDRDMVASSIIVDSNACGQRNASLAWFWNSGISDEHQDNAVLTECESKVPCRSVPLTYVTVYRVHWLRAHTRMLRWKEELILTQHEMTWTTLYFRYLSRRWKAWADAAGLAEKLGHACYAYRQEAMWERLATLYSDTFKKDCPSFFIEM